MAQRMDRKKLYYIILYNIDRKYLRWSARRKACVARKMVEERMRGG